MATPYVGEIRMFAGNFAPVDWLLCSGQILAIAEFETLFNLIGTTYGGDGQSTFGLPDLRGRVPVHQGGGVLIGQAGGTETVTVTLSQLPSHQHPLTASSSAGTAATPAKNLFAAGPPRGIQIYTDDNTVLPSPTPIAATGGSQPHENHQPLLAITFIISPTGIFPSQ